jgi:hypothetical protein
MILKGIIFPLKNNFYMDYWYGFAQLVSVSHLHLHTSIILHLHFQGIWYYKV